MTDRTGALGVVDWGIGGMGFYRGWHAALPEAPVIYLSDAGATPYGKLPRARLAQRLEEVVGLLAAEGASRVVVACNAASTVVAEVASPVPLTGIIAAGIAAALEVARRSAARRREGRPEIGVIGGGRTIRAGLHRRALVAGGLAVRQRIAQPLSALIEAGCLGGPVLEAALDEILHPLRGVDLLLLACTHYPAIAPQIAARLPGAVLIDPAEHLVATLAARPARGRAGAEDRFLTTGDPGQMQVAARAAFGVELRRVERVWIGTRSPSARGCSNS